MPLNSAREMRKLADQLKGKHPDDIRHVLEQLPAEIAAKVRREMSARKSFLGRLKLFQPPLGERTLEQSWLRDLLERQEVTPGEGGRSPRRITARALETLKLCFEDAAQAASITTELSRHPAWSDERHPGAPQAEKR